MPLMGHSGLNCLNCSFTKKTNNLVNSQVTKTVPLIPPTIRITSQYSI